jgi:hypothetical protein
VPGDHLENQTFAILELTVVGRIVTFLLVGVSDEVMHYILHRFLI